LGGGANWTFREPTASQKNFAAVKKFPARHPTGDRELAAAAIPPVPASKGSR